MQRFIKLPARGDTIVEVMISMAILAVVVGAAYASATRSFDSSLNSQYRDQGVSYAQQQLELIKESDIANDTLISVYKASPGTAFCIDPATKSKINVSSGTTCATINKGYSVSITYCDVSPCAGGQAEKSFLVTTTWDSATSLPQQSALFYKPNDSFAGSTVACRPSDPGCVSTVTNPPSVQVAAALANPIAPGVTDNITWSAINIRPGSCTATGPGTFSSSVNSNADPGSYPFSSASAGTYTFTVNCKDNSGGPVFNSANVVVNNPVPVATTGGASVITYNSATLNGNVNPNGNPVIACTFYYDTASFAAGSVTPGHGTPVNCSQSLASLGTGSSTPGPAVSASTGATLSASTPYHFQLCVRTSGGTSCGSDGNFPTDPLPPPPLQVYFCDDINYSGTCYGPFGRGDYAYVGDYGIPNDAESSMFFNTSTTDNVYIMWDINFGGICHVMSSNTPDFRYTDPRGSWNDAMSSFVIGVMNISGPSCS